MSARRSMVNNLRWQRFAPSAAKFDNVILRELPIDPETRNFTRNPVVGACYSRISPTPIENPELVIVSKQAMALAGIHVYSTKDLEEKNMEDSEDIETLVPILAGNKLLKGSETASQCYCGHQFGFFTGQLGDGAAIYLGEVLHTKPPVESDPYLRYEIQLKGAGKTPYSRQHDGRKVLRSTIREFLASEHLAALGIRTTRAASVIMSRTTTVPRDPDYSGKMIQEPTAVVLRVAKSFFRFGTFEICKTEDPYSHRSGPSGSLPVEERQNLMTKLWNFSCKQNFSDIVETSTSVSVDVFVEIIQRTALLVAQWQGVGFCHGVLNTDNMSIVGDTIDYGPYGFMEYFNAAHICNTSDDRGRYRYENQPTICAWNCGVLGDQLVEAGILSREECDKCLLQYGAYFEIQYYTIFSKKLGLKASEDMTQFEHKSLVTSLFDVMEATGSDFTCTFRALSDITLGDEESIQKVVNEIVSVCQTIDQRKQKYPLPTQVSGPQLLIMREMLTKNPEQARQYRISEELFVEVEKQQEKLKELNAFTNETYREHLAKLWLQWMSVYVNALQGDLKKMGIRLEEYNSNRKSVMNANNPIYVLRNHVAQAAIEFAEKGDTKQLDHIFHLITHPYEKSSESDRRYELPQDPSMPTICVSCSS